MRRRAQVEGASAVTFVMALPLIAALLCAVADIGRAAYLGMEADAAAQAACRYAAEKVAQGDGLPGRDEALSAAFAAAPGVAADGAACTVDVRALPIEAVEVDRKTFDPDAACFKAEPVELSRRRIEVRLRVDAACLTPVGAAALSASGSANGLSLSSRASRTVTVGASGGEGAAHGA